MFMNNFVEKSLNVMMPFSLHVSHQSCAVVSPRVMSKGLQGHGDKSFISRDRPHHAAQHTTSSYRTHTGFISREQHHHKHIHTRGVDRRASSEPEHVHAECRSRRREGREKEGKAENNNSTEAVQVVAKEIKQTQKAK